MFHLTTNVLFMKTIPTTKNVTDFLNTIENSKRKSDCFTVLELMKSCTNSEPVMWGPSIVGFGTYHYKYESGREGDFMLTGFSPRKQNLTLYIMSGFSKHPELMEKLGKYKTGKSCLYINNLDHINLKVLEELIKKSITYIANKYS